MVFKMISRHRQTQGNGSLTANARPPNSLWEGAASRSHCWDQNSSLRFFSFPFWWPSSFWHSASHFTYFHLFQAPAQTSPRPGLEWNSRWYLLFPPSYSWGSCEVGQRCWEGDIGEQGSLSWRPREQVAGQRSRCTSSLGNALFTMTLCIPVAWSTVQGRLKETQMWKYPWPCCNLKTKVAEAQIHDLITCYLNGSC